MVCLHLRVVYSCCIDISIKQHMGQEFQKFGVSGKVVTCIYQTVLIISSRRHILGPVQYRNEALWAVFLALCYSSFIPASCSVLLINTSHKFMPMSTIPN